MFFRVKEKTDLLDNTFFADAILIVSEPRSPPLSLIHHSHTHSRNYSSLARFKIPESAVPGDLAFTKGDITHILFSFLMWP